ncbi:hypothetical protein [Maribacter hydrothermalis]|uniref:Uncharacterized protein n=1 Tax=Maribacter hydrothermalis TaxID=1836467 RepID=A0A1B7Z1K2_9FLAO|nr:hypothetical protein [Maribacter hydrothermalis]APQ18217.1 hypothetical protein BTR34_13175 [Maribacter hydrothermalis]OBR36564.1 hypothetical protein A9200_09065 [Maribacter hydrothermalis]
MKKSIYLLGATAFLILSSFKTNVECEYANSNMGYAKVQTNAALLTDDINQARFYTYKAINAIEKTKTQLDVCGCIIAKKSIYENIAILLQATKSTTLEGTKNYLNQSIVLTENTILTLDSHDSHNSSYSNDLLTVNTKPSTTEIIATKETKNKKLFDTIDASLEKYEISLNKVVEGVNCEEATAFAKSIYSECEKQLLNPNLSEGSKYYNLRTKNITKKALNKIGNCNMAK